LRNVQTLRSGWVKAELFVGQRRQIGGCLGDYGARHHPLETFNEGLSCHK